MSCTSWPFLGFLYYRTDKEKVTDSLTGQSCWCVGPQLELSEGEVWSPFLDPRDRTVKSARQRDVKTEGGSGSEDDQESEEGRRRAEKK